MKIPISSLLLTIVIFQHFGELIAIEPGECPSTGERRARGRPKGSLTTRRPGQVLGRPRTKPADPDQFRVADPNDELNATEPGESSSTVVRRKPGRPRGHVPTPLPGHVLGRPRGSRTDQDQFRVADPIDGSPNRVVYYGQVEIKVWLDGPLVRKAIYPGNYIPQGKYYKYHKFLIRTMERGDVRLVAYISERGTLTGVRPPYTKGHKYDLEPTSTAWYINYHSTHLKVEVVNSAPTGVSLMSGNVHVPAENLFDFVNVAGITFKLFREWRNFKITGAELVSYDFRTA